jgi:ABC-2 type transport system permease protein
MNTETNPASAAVLPVAVATTTATSPFFWSVRRELWGNRSLYVATLAVAIIVPAIFCIFSLVHPESLRVAFTADASVNRAAIGSIYGNLALAILGAATIVSWVYCTDALHGERADRSILFWKSLPVSDTTTVLAKASIPFVVLPAITLVMIIGGQLVLLLLHSAFLAANGLDASVPWTYWHLPWETAVALYALVTAALWSAPVFGWLFLVSAWAQRTTFLWAVLPPLGIAILQPILFHESTIAMALKSRLFFGSFEKAFDFSAIVKATIAAGALGKGVPPPPGTTVSPALDVIADPMKFIANPEVWLGLVFAAACIAGAVWLRRYRDPA